MAQHIPGGAPHSDDRTESVADWFALHVREIAIAATVVVVAVAGFYAYRRVSTGTETKAEQAYFAAQQAAGQGDNAQLESQLDRVAGQYRGTAGGTQAAMTLARLRYNAGKYDEGLATLQRLQDGGVSDEFKPAVAALLAAGYEGQAKFTDAASAYGKAADAARFEAEAAGYRADAARVLAMGGDTASAVKIWEQIAADPTAPLADEARVRLGELTARPAQS